MGEPRARAKRGKTLRNRSGPSVFRDGLAFPELPGIHYHRPKRYAQCLESGLGIRGPCPYVSCKHHLYLDVSESGHLKVNFPDLDPTELFETCSLAVAAQRANGELEIQDIGPTLNIRYSRVAQITRKHLRRVLTVLED